MNIFFLKPGEAASNFPHSYAVLAAYARQLGHSVRFYDASLRGESVERVLRIQDVAWADVVAMTIFTGWHQWARQFTSRLKELYPEKIVVVGGPHVSALGPYAVEHIGANYGVIGEGEIPMGKILSLLGKPSDITVIPGVISKTGGGWNGYNGMLERFQNLDELPMPAYDVVPPRDYFNNYLGAAIARKRLRSIQTVTSRGCPFNCTFCATNVTWKRRILFQSPSRVLQEVGHLAKDHGIEEIWWGDDAFTANRARATEICERLIVEHPRLVWRLANGIRLETVDDKLVALMRKAGCYMAGVGVETGSKTVMKRIKKHLNLDIVNDKVGILKKHGILTSGFFIIGFPDETIEELEETVQFILNCALERMQISIFAPYPGSEEFNKLFRIHDPAFFERSVRQYLADGQMPESPVQLDVQTLQRYFRNTYFRFYTKPRVMTSVLKNVRPRQLIDILRHPGFQRLFLIRRSAKDTYVKFENV
jgi:radical SAM superfamily enzyme YgiQ (UPF0313 family)